MPVLALVFAALPVQVACPPERTLRLDAIELVAGREVEGSPEFALQHGRHAYLFTSAANRDAFQREPAKYEIQLGGACARMGPLSGAGSTTLTAVHEGKIYVFASVPCRKRFLEAPEKLLEGPDPAPEADAESRARGAALLGKALAWMGGEAAFDALQNVTWRQEQKVEQGGKEYVVRKELVLDLAGGRARESECWNDSCFGNILTPERATTLKESDGELVPSQRAALERALGHALVPTLARRKAPGAIVRHAGAGEFLGRAAERVEVWAAGVSATLAIDPASGAVLGIAYRGRGPTWAMGLVEERFDDWRDVGKVRFPYRREQWFEGARAQARDVIVSKIEVDRSLGSPPFEASPR